MLHLANPHALWLLLAVPPLVGWWLRRRRHALGHPGAGLLAGLPSGRARTARLGGALLRGAALAALAVALAGPRWPDLRTRIDTEGIAILMVVDVSGSMAERDFDWEGEPVTRLEAVQRVFRRFVAGDPGDAAEFPGRPTDLIGLVSFATRPETTCPLTLSHSALLRLLEAERPRGVPGESETNLSDALALALARLRGAGPRRKVLILLSDGEHNQPRTASSWTPRQTARVAAALGVPIYAIDAGGGPLPDREGGTEDSPGLVRARAVETLRELAEITHGRSFAARDTSALLDACRTIDRLERTTIQSFQYRRYHEGYPWFALAAFLLLSATVALERTAWRRVP